MGKKGKGTGSFGAFAIVVLLNTLLLNRTRPESRLANT